MTTVEAPAFEVPEHILTAKIEHKRQNTVSKAKLRAKTSSFLITFNPNVSYKTIEHDIEKRKELGQRLLKLSYEIEQAFRAGLMLKPKGGVAEEGWRPPPVNEFKSELQLSQDLGYLHTHNIVKFLGVTHINNKALRNFIEERGWKGFHLNVRFVYDYAENARNYIARDNPSEAKTQPATLSELHASFPLPRVRFNHLAVLE